MRLFLHTDMQSHKLPYGLLLTQKLPYGGYLVQKVAQCSETYEKTIFQFLVIEI